MAIDLLM